MGAGETPYGGICGRRHEGVRGGGVTGRVKNTGTLGGDTQFGGLSVEKYWMGVLKIITSYLLGEYPWHAAILKREELDNLYVCGGSLVRENIILTAAHCVDKYGVDQLR